MVKSLDGKKYWHLNKGYRLYNMVNTCQVKILPESEFHKITRYLSDEEGIEA